MQQENGYEYKSLTIKNLNNLHNYRITSISNIDHQNKNQNFVKSNTFSVLAIANLIRAIAEF